MRQTEFLREYKVKRSMLIYVLTKMPQYAFKEWVDYPEEDLAKACIKGLKERAVRQKKELDETLGTINDIRLKYRDRKERGCIQEVKYDEDDM